MRHGARAGAEATTGVRKRQPTMLMPPMVASAAAVVTMLPANVVACAPGCLMSYFSLNTVAAIGRPEAIPLAMQVMSRVREAFLPTSETPMRDIERIPNTGKYLDLVMNDPWFAWLSPLSQLIVSLDETLEAEEPIPRAAFDRLQRQSSQLLVAEEQGSGFSKHYFEALQRDPAVVLAHAQVAKLPGWRKSQK